MSSQSKKPLGIAIVGCGMISQYHLAALQNIDLYRICGVYDYSLEIAKKTATEFGTNAYPFYEELLSDPNVDVVDICLPSGYHAEYGLMAIKAGKDIIVEKPIDVTLENAEKLIETCNQLNRKIAVIFQNRFTDAAIKIKKVLEANLLGPIIAVEASVKWYRNPTYYSSSNWKGTSKLEGGAMLNQGIHTIDLLLWFMGEVKSISALVRTALHPIEAEDLSIVLLEFQNGAIGTLTVSTALKPGFPERIEIYGQMGSLILEAGKIIHWDIEGTDSSNYLDNIEQGGSGSSNPAGIPLENHQKQLTVIAEALIIGSEPPVNGPEALKSLKLVHDIYAANHKR